MMFPLCDYKSFANANDMIHRPDLSAGPKPILLSKIDEWVYIHEIFSFVIGRAFGVSINKHHFVGGGGWGRVTIKLFTHTLI